MDFVPRAVVENATVGRAIERNAEPATTLGLSRVAAAFASFRLRPFSTRACAFGLSATFSALASFRPRARAVAAALVTTAAAVAPCVLARTLATAQGAPAIVEILLAFLVNAVRKRRAAIDERLDLLDLHAGGPEPVSRLSMLRDDFHCVVESLPLSKLDGPIGSSCLIRGSDETEVR